MLGYVTTPDLVALLQVQIPSSIMTDDQLTYTSSYSSATGRTYQMEPHMRQPSCLYSRRWLRH